MTKLHAWEKTSLDSVPDTHPVLPLIASLLLGVAVLAGTSSAPAGLCSAGLGVSMAISRSTRSAKQYDSIRKYGCYSISLDETLLAEYIRANGLEHTKAEIVWAQEQDLLISEACENLIDGITEAMPQRLPPQLLSAAEVPVQVSKPLIMPQSAFTQPAQVDPIQPNITKYIPQSKREWSIEDMVSEIDNRLVLGLKGSGKSVLVGKMLEIVRSKFPDKRIFVIDPKADPIESDIYQFADEVHSGNIGEMEPKEGLAFIKEGLDRYLKHPNPGLLILDEAIMIGGCMTDNKSNLIESKLRYIVAGGDSRGMNCWVISQSPMLADLGLKTGISSQLNLTIITTKHSLPNIKAWSGGSLMNGVVVEDALPAIDACLIPKGRAILAGGIWYPMPVIEVTWNRDLRQMNPTDSPNAEPTATPTAPKADARQMLENLYKLEDTTASATAEPTAGISEALELALVDFFQGARNLTPKAVRDCRKANRIASLKATNEEILICLESLTANGTLIKVSEGYVLPSWNTEDLN
jgi:hypothetical protein